MHIVREVKDIDKIVNELKEMTTESNQESQIMNKLLAKLSESLQEGLSILGIQLQEQDVQNRMWEQLGTTYERLKDRLKNRQMQLDK